MRLQAVQTCHDDLKPFRVPEGMVLVVDTREQRPLFQEPIEGLEVVTAALPHGDYSLQGFTDRFAVERKQVGDFFGYIGKERERTTRKMGEFKEMISAGGWAALVIEASEGDLLAGYTMSRISPETARQALVSFEVRYGVHVYYNRSRADIERWMLDRAIKYFKIQREVKA